MTTADQKAPKAPKRLTEADLRVKYPHIVEGTLRYDTEGLHLNKQTVEIKTRGLDGQFDGKTRRIATSDLHQVFWTEDTKAEMDKERRRMKAKQNRAVLKALKANAPAVTVTATVEADADKALADQIQ
jgi:hypothetical protein